ncbi:GntR family transcriptional regulator [Dermacoccus nishinomiyaensis]
MSKAEVPARYLALAGELNELIERCELTPHSLLPSERELAERHHVSRMTARKAVSLLESEGKVYRRPPRGTFVAEPRVAFRVGSFSREVHDQGHFPSARLLSAREIEPSPSVRGALKLKPGEPAYHIRRLRLLDDEPFAIESTYYPASRTPGLLDDLPEGSLWDLLAQRYGIVPKHSRARLSVVSVEERTARELSLRPGTAGILQERRTVDGSGRAIEFARDLYRADRAAFTVEEDF